MSSEQSEQATVRKTIRLWPGVAVVIVQWFLWIGVPAIAPDFSMYAMLGALACGLAVIIWWLFFSRAPWAERLGVIVLAVIAVAATKRIVHPSIAGAMMGMMLPIFAIPVLSLALVSAVAVSRRFSKWPRRAVIASAILLGCGAFTLIRTGGITGEATSDLHWRWTQSPEERLLAQTEAEPTGLTNGKASADLESAESSSGWPGFRGAKRDGVVRGVRIETDWSRQPPLALWRRSIGPGWSSFAVRGNFLYTQEQRGKDEVVSCYDLATGKPVWRHRDAVRFYESNAGAGPRATPTLSGEAIYTFGATGILNALDASNGSVIWSRNAASDTKTSVPSWGFASSPLVAGDAVIVAAAGNLAAYDINTGNPRWFGPTGGRGYSSPHLATIDGVEQVLMLNGEGILSLAPADGALVWKYVWECDSIVQPAFTADGDLLIGSSGTGMGSEVGVHRVGVKRAAGAWTTQERWTSTGLKPYFNDFVVHNQLAFGFDGSNLACIDLTTGERKWKGARYGHGQIIVLPEQDVLLVLSEQGEVALVAAKADEFVEMGRFQAVQGKTWNHPVLVGDVLLVRNAQEMAAFRLAPAKP